MNKGATEQTIRLRMATLPDAIRRTSRRSSLAAGISHEPPLESFGDRIEPRLRAIEAHNYEIEAHNRVIHAQLLATQEMVRVLTEMVRTMQPDSASPGPSSKQGGCSNGPDPALAGVAVKRTTRGPPRAVHPAPAIAHTEGDATSTGDGNVTTTPPVRRRRMSPVGMEEMTRTLNIAGMLGPGKTQDQTLAPLQLKAVAAAVKRFARVGSNKSVQAHDAVVPTMTEQSSSSSLNANTITREDPVETKCTRRMLQWWCSLFDSIRVRSTATKPVLLVARLEGVPTHRFTIRHDSNWRIGWDVVVMILTVADVVMTPLSLSFTCCSQSIAFVNALVSFMFAIDIVIRALSSFTDKRGKLISGPKHTIPHYLFSVWVVADLLSWFPFEYLASNGRFLGVAKIIRLVKISQLMRRFQSARKAGVFRLLRLISIVLLVSHLLACYWNWVAT